MYVNNNCFAKFYTDNNYLEHIPLNKHNHQHELNFTYNIAHKNNFYLKINNKICKYTKEKMKHNSIYTSDEFAKILNKILMI